MGIISTPSCKANLIKPLRCNKYNFSSFWHDKNNSAIPPTYSTTQPSGPPFRNVRIIDSLDADIKPNIPKKCFNIGVYNNASATAVGNLSFFVGRKKNDEWFSFCWKILLTMNMRNFCGWDC
jgi:hypothetical protein